MILMALIRARLAKRKVDKLIDITGPALVPAYHLFEPELRRLVPQWELDNDALMTFLGYVAGIIDAGEYRLFCKPGHPRKGGLIIDLAFHQAINALLKDLPGTNLFLDANLISLKLSLEGNLGGQGAISGMQSSAAFCRAQLAGGNDFLSLIEGVLQGRPGVAPLEMFELLKQLKACDSLKSTSPSHSGNKSHKKQRGRSNEAQILYANCSCGFHKEIFLGRGCANELFPSFCLDCETLVDIDCAENPPTCPECGSELLIPYDSEEMPHIDDEVCSKRACNSHQNFNFPVEGRRYFCPKCRCSDLKFSLSGE